MKKLRIAHIAPLWFTVPPKKYGGIERIVAELANSQVKAGHNVTLFAAKGSKTLAKLITVYPKPLIEAGIPWSNPLWNLENLNRCFIGADKFDVIHSHLDLWTLFFQQLTKTPVIHTFHNQLYVNARGLNDRLELFNIHRKNTNAVFISKAERKLSRVYFPKSWIIYNGVPLEDFTFRKNPENYFAWVARMDKHKGVENAILAAKKAGVRLLLAGRIDPMRKDYFNKTIKPKLSRKIQYIGELNEKELSKFYGGARALLYPIEWNEPFGLVMAESMACGTPVIAYPRGSVPELVLHKKTGFLTHSINGLVKAIERIDEINRKDCRTWVEKKFSVELMAKTYEKLYYHIIQKRQ